MRTFRLDEVFEAHWLTEENRGRGKLVMLVDA